MTESDVTLRPAGPDDADLVASMYRGVAYESYAAMFLGDPAIMAGLRAHFDGMANAAAVTLADPVQTYILASLGNTAVGMGGYQEERRLIHSMYLVPEARGKGLGRSMLQKLLETSNDRPVFVDVATGNAAAARFYHNAGFMEAGIVRDWILANGAVVPLQILKLS
jgi:L-amino acid N-acyltransferase YncA